MNKIAAIAMFVLIFVFFLHWAKAVVKHLGSSLDAFLIYVLPVLVISPIVSALIVYLSIN